ncbi:hypothetical protein BUALT_Bualt18G0057000 [Buddleja alternifolia]|uniref:non-specific serine/threonine protein kinase n=1 Tax=Buddleja alternifolia TaxID=168488 RepID=A0AAV6WAR7_9LAMI|nr:hypothetical protein BUALT_Bualt18G0057000 [Buddleja alternifolia]
MVGELPPELRNLAYLKTFYVNNNALSGSISSFMFNISTLKIMSLASNHFSGSLPSTIDGLSLLNLEKLYLYDNRLSGAIPSYINNASKLTELEMQNNPFSGYVPNFGPIHERLGELKSPRQVDLGLNNLNSTIPSSFWNLIDLSTLNLSSNYLSGQISPDIGSLKVINSLDLSWNQFLGDIPSSIGNPQSIEFLSLAHNKFEDLILAYMPNGSLEKWLYSESYCLDVLERVKLAIDVALGLEYLHHGHTFPVIHCDIKPSNILLDEDMTAHVADFGLSKLFDEREVMIQTNTLATISYTAPEYGSEGKVSTNGDVYSYGILLLEMFTMKNPTDDMFSGEMSLKNWVGEALLQENAINEVVAPGLLRREDRQFSAKEQCVSSVFRLAMECLAFSPEVRINMIQIVVALLKIKTRFLASN